MSQAGQFPYHQSFEFHLTDKKFMRGTIEYYGNNSFGANISVITDITTPLPDTFGRTIVCEANTTAIKAFEEIVKIVQRETQAARFTLCLVANADAPHHLSVADQKIILNRYYGKHEIPVQPF